MQSHRLVTFTPPRSVSAFAIAYAAGSGVYFVEIIAASLQAADGEQGFAFMTLFIAWLRFTPMILVFAALTVPIGLAIVRWRALPRPLVDAAGGALIAAASPFFAAFALDAVEFGMRGALDMESLFMMTADAGALGGLGASFAALPGLVGGLVYWIAAGCPHAHAPTAVTDEPPSAEA